MDTLRTIMDDIGLLDRFEQMTFMPSPESFQQLIARVKRVYQARSVLKSVWHTFIEYSVVHSQQNSDKNKYQMVYAKLLLLIKNV